jgi:hypothetical protein
MDLLAVVTSRVVKGDMVRHRGAGGERYLGERIGPRVDRSNLSILQAVDSNAHQRSSVVPKP